MKVLGSLAANDSTEFVVPPSACFSVFNLANEPAYKYSLAMIADQGTDPQRFTSSRLPNEVLYLESNSRRFELTCSNTQGEFPTFTFAEVTNPQNLDRDAIEQLGRPLPARCKDVIVADFDWEEIHWGPSYLRLRGVEYPIVNVLFLPASSPK